MVKGIFCISIDHELLWGRHDLNYKNYVSRVKKERFVIKKLLSLFTKYDIPATWAIVGKIVEKGDPLWHGKDTVNKIKSVKDQELAYHSYSHRIFNQISLNEAKKEISKLKIGTSFIFPRNIINYLPLLKKGGYTAFRGKDKNQKELLLPHSPPVYYPIKVDEVINIPGSMYFVSSRGLRKFIPFGLRYFKSVWGINNAIKQKKIFHLWFHPIDFVDNSKLLLKEFEMILQYASKQRSKNLLDIESMSGIVEKYKHNQNSLG